ncbi:MAG: hypothetical protein WAT19_00330 [Ferruginibacter sp.]
MYKGILILLSALLLLPNFINRDINKQFAYDHIEKFNPSLLRIQTAEEMEAYTDSLAFTKGINVSSPEYFVLLENNIAERFYHSYSHYTLKENWLAAVTEKFSAIALASKVRPAEIFKQPVAACSQQAIAMMQIAKNKAVGYRKVGFPHHYALELYIKGNWYFFDPSKEPNVPLQARLHQNWALNANNLKPYYNNEKYSDIDLALGIGSSQPILLGNENADPAPRAVLLQDVTALLSKTLWILPLLLLFMKAGKTKKLRRIQEAGAAGAGIMMLVFHFMFF